MQIEAGSIDRRLIDLEVARVNDHAHRRPHRQRHAVDRAVRHWDELDFVRADFDEAPGGDFAKRGGWKEASFFEAFFYEGESEARAVNGNVEVAQNISKRADVVFVSVCQHDRAHV